jgi:hypothetical protein
MNPAAILYYIPNAGITSKFGDGWLSALPEDRRERFRASATRRENVAGPVGRGLLCTWQTNVLIEHDPETQDWQQIGPQLWVGIRRGYQPEEFARPTDGRDLLSGYLVELGDGNRWLIPVALADAPSYSMPWVEGLDASGEIVRRVADPYRKVCAIADDLWASVCGKGRLEIEEDRLREALADAMAVHYQIDLQDCLALGLFSSDSYQTIVCALLDFQHLEEIRSGEAREPSDTDSGGSDSSSTIGQRTPTSSL